MKHELVDLYRVDEEDPWLSRVVCSCGDESNCLTGLATRTFREALFADHVKTRMEESE